MRTAALFSILIVLSLAAASSLEVKVVVTQDTPSVGAMVSVMTGGVALDTQKTDSSGRALFTVSDGSYFIVINRSTIYPEYIVLAEVSGNTAITVVRRQEINYANAYGQVSGPPASSNTTVSAYLNGQLAKKVHADRNGFYMLSFLNEGSYELRFESPGYVQYSADVYLPQRGFVPVNAALLPPEPEPEPALSLSSPAQVQQFSVIEISLSRGGSPVAGGLIEVSTPSGAITSATDSRGIARVNAAEGGTYSFSYGNLTSSTFVAAAQQPPRNQSNGSAAPQQPPAQPPAQPEGNGNANLLLLAAGGLVLLALLALAGIAVAAFRAAKKEGQQPGSRHEHGHQRHEGGAKRHGKKRV